MPGRQPGRQLVGEFGIAPHHRFDRFGRLLFDWFRCPVLEVTIEPVNGRHVYVNGIDTQDADPVAGGTLGDWEDVPLRGREEFLRKYVPKSSAPGVAPIAKLFPHAVVPWPLPAMEAARAPLFDYAQQEATAMHGPRLLRESGQSLFDPLGGLRIAAEMTQAFWRLWGLMPAPRRPGEKEGRWRE